MTTTKNLISTFAQHIFSEYICYLLSIFAQHIFSGYFFDTFDQQSQAEQTICSANIFLSRLRNYIFSVYLFIIFNLLSYVELVILFDQHICLENVLRIFAQKNWQSCKLFAQLY